MILHSVYLRLRRDHDAPELADVMAGLAALVPDFAHGPNRDFEGKSPGFPYGFLCRFDSPEALQAYATDETHKALGARLCDLCEGGADGITVYDLEVA